MSEPPTRYRELEAAIDALTESYHRGDPIDNLKTTALPNKRRVLEAMHEVETALFMGFYSTSPLHPDNLRHRIAEHLYRAHHLLVDQLERVLRYQDWSGRCADCPRAEEAEPIVVELFSKLPDIRERLSLDVRAAYDWDPASDSIEEIVFSYPAITAITAYRIAHQLHLLHVPMIPRIITEQAHAITGIDIHPGAEIGRSFFIDHGTGVVIGETTVIGDNVKLYQGVTLGALSVPRRGNKEKRHPTLEDEVTVYAGATILGGDTVIGKGSMIGGNVWLVDSVPPGSKVLGGAKQYP